jgi:hypothetical protein
MGSTQLRTDSSDKNESSLSGLRDAFPSGTEQSEAVAPQSPQHKIFQFEEGQTLIGTRQALEARGFFVEPILGTYTAMGFLVRGKWGEKFAIVGGGGSYTERAQMLARIKERWPRLPAVAIQHYSESPLPGADLSIAGEFDM